MKRFYLYISLVILGCFFCSCNQEALEYEEPYDHDEVVFRGSVIDAEVQTKATAVTESDLTTNGFKASCVSGSAGSDSAVWSNIVFSKSGSYWKGGKYWPTSDPTYRFYAVYPKSYSMTAAVAGATISASNAHDIVCAYASSSTYKSPNTLTFNHIFARLGSVTVNAGSGYTISGITINITPKTGGTYNLRTGVWSSTTNGSATSIANSTPGTKSNDIYLVPGTYTLTASWTAENSPYSKSFSGKTVNVNLVAGKTNNITCTLTGDGTEVEFGVSLTAWSNNAIDAGTVPLVDYPKAVGQFTINASGDKVSFAPGNLRCWIVDGPDATGYNYVGEDWCFADNQWDYLGSAGGANSMSLGKWVDLFGWVGTSADNDTYGLCTHTESNNGWYGTSASDKLKTDWGDIPGVVSALGSGWFTLTTAQWSYVFNTRNGGTVGGTSPARWTQGTIRTDVSGVNGIILFPDGCSIAAGEFTTLGTLNAASAWETKCTAAQWTALEAKGCVFLPAAGYRNGTGVSYVGSRGYYWSSSVCSEALARSVSFYSGAVGPQSDNSRRNGFSVRLSRESN